MTPTARADVPALSLAALLAAVALLAAACGAEVGTRVDLADVPAGEVTVAFTGDAADAAAAADASVEAAFARFGADPRRDAGEGRLAWHAVVDDVTSAAAVTGVADVDAGDDAARVALTSPDDVDDALSRAVADEPDADALAAAMASSTRVSVAVAAPRDILDAELRGDGGDLDVAVDGRDVTVAGALPDWRDVDAVLVVDHAPAPSPAWGWALAALLGAAAAVAAVAAAAASRSSRATTRRRPSTPREDR